MVALKLFTTPFIPNPDLVQMYLHETGRQASVQNINLSVGKGENRTSFNPNPLGEVPCLVLPDDTPLSESCCIVKYLDDALGQTSIVGLTAADRALTDMWLKRIEDKVEGPMGAAFRSGPMAKFFAPRRPGYIHPANVPGDQAAAQAGLRWVESVLAGDGRPFLCGERFSLADLRFWNNCAFYARSDPSQSIPAELKHVTAYMARIVSQSLRIRRTQIRCR